MGSRYLGSLEKALPPGMTAKLIIDQSRFVRENAREVEVAIVFGGAMAILVVLLFMLDLRSTLISAVALPTSVVATFGIMYAFGFTLNMMALLGLSLAIGLLIDDAVVVRENISKHLEGEGPTVIEREDRERQIVIWASPLNCPLGEIVPQMDAAFSKIKLPVGASIHRSDQVRQMNESNSSMALALALPVVFIYIVLASQFESFIRPLTIMLTLPLALVGAIIALFVARQTISMGSLIGIVLLMGLVTKNAILLLDRAIVRVRDPGESPLQAILASGPERLRPILMTSAAMILRMLPTALSRGEGSEFRAPMAVAVIGGVVSATPLSLVVVPAFYLAIEGFKEYARKTTLAGSVAPPDGALEIDEISPGGGREIPRFE